MRVVKKPAERKRELINIATKLFFDRGYEKTSVQDIYTEANGSFGMFYHHFASKEEIFEAAMNSFTDSFAEKLSDIVLNREIPYQKRYRMAIGHWHSFLIARDNVNDFERNVSLFRSLAPRMLSESVEPLRSYIEEGAEKGLFTIKDSRETAIFLVYGIYGLMKEERMLFASNENAPKVFKSIAEFLSKLLNAEKDFFDLGTKTI